MTSPSITQLPKNVKTHQFVKQPSSPYCGQPVQAGIACGFMESNKRIHTTGPARQLTLADIVQVHVSAGASETSRRAAAKAAPRRATLMARMMAVYGRLGGATNAEAAEILGAVPMSVSSASNSLRTRGMIEALLGDDDQPLTRPTSTNSPATVWTLTADGRRVLAQWEDAA